MFTTVSALLSRLPELGDAGAWELFEERYSPMLRRFFRSLGVGTEAAQDMAQETIARAVRGLQAGTYQQHRGHLREWMGGIARNVWRGQIRKRRPRTNVGAADGDFLDQREDPHGARQFRDIDERFDRVWIRSRLAALIRLAAETFSRRDLRCYFLVEVHQRPVADVARKLNLSPSAVFVKRRQVANWLLAVGPRFISRWER